MAVIRTGGKQYLVKENDELYVDRLPYEKGAKIEFDTLALIADEKDDIDLGTPILSYKIKGEITDQLKGDKIRVAKFKAKSRYRKVRGFRHALSKIKILKI